MQQTSLPSTDWDLSGLYQSPEDPAIKADFAKADDIIAQLESYRDRIAQLSSTELLELIQQWEQLQVIFHRIGLFAGLLDTTHTGVPAITRFMKWTEEQSIARATKVIFIETELAQLTEEQWQQYLVAPELQPYHRVLQELAIQAKHTLTEPEEKILAEKQQTSRAAFLHLFSVVTDTLQIQDGDKQVGLEEVLNRFHNPNPAVRQRAAELLHAGLKTNDKVTPNIFNTLIQDKAITDRLRHYEFPEQARFQDDGVDRETVEAMAETVTKRHDIVTRYYELKKKIMGADQLYWWDRYAPLPDVEAKVERDEAIRLVTQAYSQFSSEIGTIAAEIMDKQHVDWLPSPTKRGGAFCAMSIPGDYPYVLLNYLNTPRDAMTLAHELGHGIHDVLAGKKNVFLQTHPSLALAEIASVFGETLLFEKLINSDLSKTDKQSLLMSFIEDRFATVFRQTSMFQFEQQVHHKRRTEGELSKDEIDELWHNTMKAPFEGALTYTDEHKNTWMYVSHFFNTPFYVYSYAFAQLCVLALYQQYKEQGSSFVPTYTQLLSAGGSLTPKENLAQAGLDITQTTFWEKGLVAIEEFIDQLDELTNSVE